MERHSVTQLGVIKGKILLMLVVVVGSVFGWYLYDRIVRGDENADTHFARTESVDSIPTKRAADPKLVNEFSKGSAEGESHAIVGEGDFSDNDIFEYVHESEVDSTVLERFMSKRPYQTYTIVRINADAIREIIRKSPEQRYFDIRLPNGRVVRALSTSAEEHSAGWQSGIADWLGTVEGDPVSRVSLVITPNGAINGVIRTAAEGRIKIEQIESLSEHVLWSWSPEFEQLTD